MVLLFSLLAKQDLDEISEYLTAEAGPVRANAVLRRVLNAGSELVEDPLSGRRRPDLEAGTEELRSRVIGAYSVIYTVQENRVIIARILHHARHAESESYDVRVE